MTIPNDHPQRRHKDERSAFNLGNRPVTFDIRDVRIEPAPRLTPFDDETRRAALHRTNRWAKARKAGFRVILWAAFLALVVVSVAILAAWASDDASVPPGRDYPGAAP